MAYSQSSSSISKEQVQILIVEDDVAIYSLLATGLSEEGYKVGVTFDGQSGLRLAQQSLPVLIITDLMLPQLDGLELIKGLRANPQTQNIPVIMVSAVASKLAQAALQQLEKVEYLAKPFDLDQLLGRVAHYLAPTTTTTTTTLFEVAANVRFERVD